ncbi:MAG TPA: DUF1634 domain-containing protein [Candidatus Acidoferrales bacterium]|nr:DUF1634 domain-containing protein [Candidatus Acidoferrales bacterium]
MGERPVAQLGRSSQHERVGNVADNVYADVYKVLLAGMVLSTTLFAIGVVLALLHPAYVPLSADWVRQQYHWKTFIHGFAKADPGAFMLLATILLILTPVSRVLVSIYVFYVDRDRKYVIVTGIVFLVMVLTVILSHFGLK